MELFWLGSVSSDTFGKVRWNGMGEKPQEWERKTKKSNLLFISLISGSFSVVAYTQKATRQQPECIACGARFLLRFFLASTLISTNYFDSSSLLKSYLININSLLSFRRSKRPTKYHFLLLRFGVNGKCIHLWPKRVRARTKKVPNRTEYYDNVKFIVRWRESVLCSCTRWSVVGFLILCLRSDFNWFNCEHFR